MSAMVTEIERKDTGIRMLLTLLFVFILHAVEVVLAVTVLFSLAVALFTKRVVLPACTNLLLESRFDPLLIPNVGAKGVPLDMPIWGTAFIEQEDGTIARESRALGKILSLIHYVQSIQTPMDKK